MEKARKREILQAYKEEKRPGGIFAVRCAATGEVWIGKSRNLGQQQNREWFTLRQGSHSNRKLQTAWTAQGEDTFTFEVLEEVDGEGMSALGLTDALKSKDKEWRDALGGEALVG
ncbi:MAG TPA: GIY-YIG nuclease family protein [Caulobacteraceae bacterium]